MSHKFMALWLYASRFRFFFSVCFNPMRISCLLFPLCLFSLFLSRLRKRERSISSSEEEKKKIFLFEEREIEKCATFFRREARSFQRKSQMSTVGDDVHKWAQQKKETLKQRREKLKEMHENYSILQNNRYVCTLTKRNIFI